jgi:S1-C subfamily serine protease
MVQVNALEIGDLLKDCTVKLTSKNTNVTKVGTAFFVGPGRLLTCLHVVQGLALEAEWQGQTFGANIDRVGPQERDLALLSLVAPPNHPCCVLGDAYPYISEQLVGFGYTETYPLGDSGSYECEGISNHGVDGKLLKVKAGQAFPGMSGGPLVRLTTGRVCAVIATERLNTSMGGARALPMDTVYQIWPDLKILQNNEKCTKRWLQVLPNGARDDQNFPVGLEDGFEFSIPAGWTFRDVVDTMTALTSGVSDYQGFTPEELSAPIRNRSIAAKSLKEAIVQLRLITDKTDAVRPYQVTRKGSMYLLTVPGRGI